MNFFTERLEIRPFTKEDADAVYAFCSLPEVMDLSGMGAAHTSLEQTQRELGRWMRTGCKHAMVLRETGQVIGEISVKPDSEEQREDTRELGCALHPAYQHKGYMTEAVQGALGWLQKAGIRYVWACCFVENAPSRALIERCGFAFRRQGSYTVKTIGERHQSLEYCMELPCAEPGTAKNTQK